MSRSGGGATRVAERVRVDPARAYVALLGAALAIGFVSWPIFAADTDLWYHLNAGRYIATSHGLPQTAFFSFLRPSPAWLDYYWLSQVLFYTVHSLAGYFGLVQLRALAALGTYAFILASLRYGQRGAGWGYTAIVFTAASLFLVGRLTMVRPGDLSYLSIAAFLFILESRRGLLALPALALLWMNLHGIEYPVMLLILGAYLGEWTLARLGVITSVTAPPWSAFAAAGASLLAALATPHGIALIAAPFRSLTFASQYIQELAPVDVPGLLALRVDALYVSRPTFLALLIVGSGLALLAGLQRASWRPAHWALLAGALFLLTRVQRFSAEFVLLVIPLLAAFRPSLSAKPLLNAPLRAGLALAIAVFPFWHLYKVLETSCAFPLCTRALPEGSVAFLNRVGATGTVLNHPNDGGYLEWELSPRQQIYSDLQTPFLFSDRDVFRGDQAFQDPTVLEGLVSEYHPAFLLVPRKLAGVGTWVDRVSDFAPVFVDDASVLYASSARQPDLVARYRLTAIDPFALVVAGDPTDPQVLARAAQELARANEIYPAGGRMRVFEGALALARGDSDSALRISEAVVAAHPDRWEGQRLRGDVLSRLQRTADACQAYEAALKHTDIEGSADQTEYLQKRLWSCYTHLGRREDAYRALRAALGDLYRPSVGYQELASLALAALDAGHELEGRTLLGFALAKTPASEAELRGKLEAKLRSLAPSR